MADPLSLLPLALAAGRGRLDDFDAGQVVAAGVTLLQRCAPLVRAMAGRRAAILLPTSPQFLTALAACDGRGAVLVNPLAAPPEIAWQFLDADVGAVFTTRALSARLPGDAASRLPIVLLDDAPRHALVAIEGRTINVDLGSHRGLTLEGDRDAVGSDETCAIVYTSAMAGRPRGAMLSHRNLLANGRSTVSAAEMRGDDHALALLPFSHLFGLTVSCTAPLLAGARVTTMERFHPIKALDLIEREGVTQLVGVPAVYAALVQAIQRRGSRLRDHALRVCICGGAVLPVSLQERFAEVTGIELRQGYGLTEAAPVALFNRPSDTNHRGMLGTPFPGVEVSIRDRETSREVAAGRSGEIWVRGENVFQGYVNGATDGLQVVDGWLATGDEGAQHDDGVVEFVGLIKPMFTRNGFNIYPREIERVVRLMPGVHELRVYGEPESTRENDIVLDVLGTDITEAGVRAWCEAQLSAYKQPTIVNVATMSDVDPRPPQTPR